MDNTLTFPQQALELITVQSGAVVSKEILSKSTGNITLFAFDQGQGLSEHRAPFDAFLHVLQGEATIILDGQTLEMAAGDFVIFPADHPHSVKAKTPLKLLLTMIKS